MQGKRTKSNQQGREPPLTIAFIERSFAQPLAAFRVPTGLTPKSAKHEARKRRANERPRVGCCEELGRRMHAIAEDVAIGVFSKAKARLPT